MSEDLPPQPGTESRPQDRVSEDLRPNLLSGIAEVENPEEHTQIDASITDLLPPIDRVDVDVSMHNPSLPIDEDPVSQSETDFSIDPAESKAINVSTTDEDNTAINPKYDQPLLSFFDSIGLDPAKFSKYGNVTHDAEVLQRRLDHIASYTGLDAHKIARTAPFLLGFREEGFDARIKMLEDLGLDAVKIANRFPQGLSLAPETFADRFAKLAKRGLDAKKIYENAPGVIALNDDKIDAVLDFLKDNGVEDPIRAVNGTPILMAQSLAADKPDSMPNKVRNLENLGLDVAIVLNRRPKILTGKIETIQKNMKTLNAIAEAFGFSGIEVAHTNPYLIDFDANKMELAARLALSTNRTINTPDDLAKALQPKVEETFLKAAGEEKSSVGTIVDKRARALEAVTDPEKREKAGAFATLSYANALPEDQRQEVLGSIEEQGDIKLLPIVKGESKDLQTEATIDLEDRIASKLEEFMGILQNNPPSEAYLARFGFEKIRAKDLYDADKILRDSTASSVSKKIAATFLEDIKTGRAAEWQ